MTDTTAVPTWRKVAAVILDFLTAFFVGGFIVGALTGNLTASGFNLQGWSALLLFVLIIIYFIVGRKLLGGTLWQRILGATGR